jgi:CRISPR system Cascade subunit CasB
MSADQKTTTTDNRETKTVKIDYSRAVGKIARMMESKSNLSRGDLAELRRVSSDEPFTPALWRLLLLLNLDESPHWIKQQKWERRWAILMMGMAHCAGLHDYNISLGQALAQAGWSELRFVQLMRAKGTILEKHLRRVAQFLSSKNQSADWTDVARLLFFQSGDNAENVRLDISRNYYSTVYAQENG